MNKYTQIYLNQFTKVAEAPSEADLNDRANDMNTLLPSSTKPKTAPAAPKPSPTPKPTPSEADLNQRLNAKSQVGQPSVLQNIKK